MKSTFGRIDDFADCRRPFTQARNGDNVHVPNKSIGLFDAPFIFTREGIGRKALALPRELHHDDGDGDGDARSHWSSSSRCTNGCRSKRVVRLYPAFRRKSPLRIQFDRFEIAFGWSLGEWRWLVTTQIIKPVEILEVSATNLIPRMSMKA